MPDPTPLSPLAGIEQMLNAYRDAVFQNGKVYGLDSLSAWHEEDDADDETPRKAILTTLATLREVLTELPENPWLAGGSYRTPYLDERRQYAMRCEVLVAKLRVLLTPDSPRQAGEENTNG